MTESLTAPRTLHELARRTGRQTRTIASLARSYELLTGTLLARRQNRNFIERTLTPDQFALFLEVIEAYDKDPKRLSYAGLLHTRLKQRGLLGHPEPGTGELNAGVTLAQLTALFEGLVQRVEQRAATVSGSAVATRGAVMEQVVETLLAQEPGWMAQVREGLTERVQAQQGEMVALRGEVQQLRAELGGLRQMVEALNETFTQNVGDISMELAEQTRLLKGQGSA